MTDCRHREGEFVRGSTTLVDRHDCAYVSTRERHIEACYQAAVRDVTVSGVEAGPRRDNLVTRVFMEKMNAAMNTPNWEDGPARDQRWRQRHQAVA